MKTSVLAGLISILLTVFLGFLILPFLKRLKIGQPILKYVEEHAKKSGTPTMGGLFFMIASTVLVFIFSSGKNRLGVLALSISLAFMLVGFIDDFIKIKFRKNEGLTARQKLTFQIVISLIASYFAYESGLDFLYLPFTAKKVTLGVFSIFVNALIFVATVNAVNLTDGLDGLCASVSAVYFTVIAIVILLQIKLNNELYVVITEYKNVSLYSIILAGSMLGYLLFNTQKASVFMGDTGSLAIGGAISSISIFTGNTLFIPVLGVCFVLSAITVIIQVLHYKRTKNRVFLMAPIHHHFQKLGYSEGKISYAYFLITLVLGLTVIICYL